MNRFAWLMFVPAWATLHVLTRLMALAVAPVTSFVRAIDRLREDER